MRYLAVLLVLVLAWPCFSQDSLVISGASYHVNWREYTYNNKTHPFNEMNLGLGIEHANARWMFLSNSYYKVSFAGMWVPKWSLTDNLTLAPRLGATTGYYETPVGLAIAPILGAEVDYTYKGIHYIFGAIAPGVLTFHIQVDL